MNDRMKDDRLDIPWYNRTIVGMEVGPTGAQTGIDREDAGFAVRFSGKEIVEMQVKANSEYLVIWCKDNEFTYYNSDVEPKAPGLGERDVLRECVDAARSCNLPVIAYCCMQYDNYIWRCKPEFRMADNKGNPIGGRVCYNSGYLEHVKKLVREMLEYGIDGFHFDMMDQGFGPPYGCWCEKCRDLFEAEYGFPMPDGIPWDKSWDRILEFRYNTSARFEKSLYDFVKSINPAATADFNYHGYPPFSWEVGQRPVQHAHIGDFVTGESGTWAFGSLHTSLLSLFLAATKPGAVFQVAIQKGVHTYHDMTTRPVEDIRWEVFTLLSHGATVTMIDKLPFDGKADKAVYERMGVIFGEAGKKKAHFGHKPVYRVGLYYSSRSRDWYGKENPDLYQRAFIGAHKAMVHEHIPMGVVLDENLSLDRLRQFPVLLLPNAAILTEEEVRVFQQYVAEGGNLIATGLTGLYGQFGEELDHCSLSEMIGARYIEKMTAFDNFIEVQSGKTDTGDSDINTISKDITLDWPFLVYGQAAVFEATTAESYGSLYRPHRTLRQKKGQEPESTTLYPNSMPLSADTPVGPAVIMNKYGKGKAVYIPCSPDAAVGGVYRNAEPRYLLRNIVRYLDPGPEIEISAPMNIETVITEDKVNRLIRIHFIGFLLPAASTGVHRPLAETAMIEEAPLYRAAITIRRPYKDIKALNPATRIKKLKEHVAAEIEDIHETIIISY